MSFNSKELLIKLEGLGGGLGTMSTTSGTYTYFINPEYYKLQQQQWEAQQQYQQQLPQSGFFGNGLQQQYNPPTIYILPNGQHVTPDQWTAIYKLGNTILQNLPLDVEGEYYLTPAQYLAARVALVGSPPTFGWGFGGFNSFYWRGVPIIEVTGE